MYLERDFVASGFQAVAQRIAASTGVAVDTLFDFLWRGFEGGRRGRAFDDVRASFPDTRAVTVSELVEAYRSHVPDIKLSEEVRSSLVRLRAAGYEVGAISDGRPQVQAAKVAALGLKDLVDPIVLTGEWGEEFSKPHPRGYELVEQEWRLAGSQLLYVADNPLKDFVTPNRRGWRTIRVRRPGQLHSDISASKAEFAAAHEARSIAGACELILSSAP